MGQQSCSKMSDMYQIQKRNLISLGMLDATGCNYSGKDGVIKVIKDSRLVLVGEKSNGLYVVKRCHILRGSLNLYKRKFIKRGPFQSTRGLQELEKPGILPQGIYREVSFCEQCIFGKAKKQSLQKSEHTTKGILDYVHSDRWGPAQTPS